QDIRTVSYLLHPPMLDELGLASVLRSYVEGFSKRSGIKVRLNFEIEIGRLPSAIELALFRVVQESLTNVHRHSGSKTASIHLARQEDGIVMEIRDQGRGLPFGKFTSAREMAGQFGVGIGGMHERLRELGGTLQITSSQKGAVVRASVPSARR